MEKNNDSNKKTKVIGYTTPTGQMENTDPNSAIP